MAEEVRALGKVQMTPKGEYNPATQYVFLDIVSANGGSYLALKSSLNVPVTNTEYWLKLAEKGNTGSAAGFGTPTATAETLEEGSEATVSVTATGTDLEKVFAFVFGIPKGDTGVTGNGIESIEKTDTTGNVDTYTITYTDGTSTTFNVTNGTDGESAGFGTPQISVDANVGTPYAEVTATGSDAEKVFTFAFHNLKGNPGFSPTVSVEDITGGHKVTITDATGDHEYIVMDGVDGTNGVSPEVTVAEITGGHSVTITDAEHPDGQTFNVMDGEDGASDAGDVTYDASETYSDGTVGKAISEQSSQIASLDSLKADKTALQNEVARLTAVNARQDKSIEFLSDAIIGVQAKKVTDNTEAYSKAITAYPQFTAKMADVKSICGKTWVKNQLVLNQNSWEEKGITFTKNGDGSWNVTGTATGDARSPLLFQLEENRESQIYLVRGTPSGGSTESYYFGGRYIYSAGTGKVDVGNGIIIKDIQDLSYSDNFRITIMDGTTVDLVFWPNVINLTRFFNGNSTILNSIDTPEDAYALGVPRTYIPYNAGELISADCSGPVSRGKNLWGGNAIRQKCAESGMTGTDGEFFELTRKNDYVFFNKFKENTRYTFIFKGYKGGSTLNTNFKFVYSDDSFDYIKINLGESPTSVATVSASGKTVVAVAGASGVSSGLYIYPDGCGLFEGNITAEEFVPYRGTLGTMSIPPALRTAHPLRSCAPDVYDEYNISRKYTKVAVGDVDLGTIDFSFYPENQYSPNRFAVLFSQMKTGSFAICQKYSFKNGNPAIGDNLIVTTNGGYITVVDSSFGSDVNAFKSAMNGIHLHYELSTTIYYYDPTSPELAVNGGTVTPDATHIVDSASYFPSDTILPVEDGGSLTFEQTETEFAIPNTEDIYYVKTQEVTA